MLREHLVKSFILIVATMTVFVATGAPVSAADNASSDQAQSAPSEKKICRRDSRDTGSILSKRVCHTKAEWHAIEEQTQRNLDRNQNIDHARSMSAH